MMYWVLFLLALAVPVEAKNLYVNNSGSPACNNATTYANNDAANPWCLIGRAAWGSTNPNSPNAGQAALAGDIVLITAGTYTTDGLSGGGRWDVALNPANDGALGNRITFRGVGTVIIRMTASHTGPTIGANGRDYITWDNITIDDTFNGSVGDTGPVVFHDGLYGELIYSTIQGHNGSYNDGHATFVDNYNAVRTEATTGTRIANNRLSRVTGNSNSAAIMIYDAADTLIEHNEIFNSGSCIYVKGDHAADGWPQINTWIRLNFIYGCSSRGVGMVAGNTTTITQNIIASSTYGIRFYDAASPDRNNITVQNNTLYHIGSGDICFNFGSTTAISAMRIFNNICYGAFDEAMNLGSATPFGMSVEHNVYYNYVTFGSAGGTAIPIATWKGTYSMDSVSPAAITTNPLLVNGSGTLSLATDFKLQGGSPAAALGIDILNLNGGGTSGVVPAGAYITGNETIGVESSAASSDRHRLTGGARIIGTWRAQ